MDITDNWLIVFLFLSFIVGACWGSFLGVLAFRKIKKEALIGRSKCDYCFKTLSIFDLIPVLSYLFLKGRCRYCKKSISPVLFLSEIITGIGFVFLCLYFMINIEKITLVLLLNVAGYFLILNGIVVILIADWRFHLIPDYSLLLIIVGVLLLKIPFINLESIIQMIFSGMVIFSFLFLLWWVTMARGIGFGDVKLSFIIGFYLGIGTGFLALYISFLIAGFFAFLLLLTKKASLKTRIAFGPYLIIGSIVANIFAPILLNLFFL